MRQPDSISKDGDWRKGGERKGGGGKSDKKSSHVVCVGMSGKNRRPRRYSHSTVPFLPFPLHEIEQDLAHSVTN